MSSESFKYLYGPVPSRRLGRSLGIDLAPFKTCTYDCIYCQLGRTTNKTMERLDYAPVKDIIRELKVKLTAADTFDYISIAGSGEPTLHAYINELIAMIKNMTRIPVAVLTNGSLLYLPEVRAALMRADLVIPSLDAGDETMFQYVNRPHPSIVFDRMVNGLIDFTADYPGQVWLEVLLVSGVTGMDADVKKIAALAEKIHAKKVQLGTICRPATEEYACAVDARQLKKLSSLFTSPVEILADSVPEDMTLTDDTGATDADIWNLLARRPCTLVDVCQGLGLHPHDAAKRLQRLIDEKMITALRVEHDIFYKIAEKLE